MNKMEKKPLKLNIKKPLKLKIKGKGGEKPVMAGDIESTAGGITIILKNAKIYAEKVIIKRAD